ncbi:hypothetical protein M434DRAFT_391906 [Hypoxylon sp. CO27-5]|nr:hypothetical protein M434DRAFT_391906 [Hypoxylon sp. CO27-5]
MAAYPGCTLGDNIQFSATNYQANGKSDPAVLVQMTNLPGSGCQAAMVQKQVKMCPGIQYELTFAMGYVNMVGNSQVQSNADCTVRWLTGTPSSWNNNDNYQSSSTYSIGLNNNVYKTFGPWSLHVAAGDAGVTKQKKNLFVDLTAVIQCGNANGGAGRFVIRDVQLNPVGQVTRSIGEEKANVILERDDAATNITVDLAPYYPDQKKGAVLITSFTANVTKREEGLF